MSWLHTGQDIKRLNELVSILFKHGFSDLVRRLNLAAPLEHFSKLLRYPTPREYFQLSPAVRFRMALEEMGPTFVKLGQILATRVDLIEPDWIQELEKLQDRAPKVEWEELRAQLTHAWGKAPEEVFAVIDKEPIGTASMAQVHRAVMKTGEEVVLKIRRPGIKHKIASDLRIMHQIAKIMNTQSEDMRRYQPEQVIAEFDKSLNRELDFTLEGKHAERMANNLKTISYIVVPKVYWEWTRESVNVQQFIKGIPARNIEAIKRAGLDPRLIAKRGAEVCWRMMLIDGFFHADPHPGNFLILPNNRIAMLDYGMVGRISQSRRDQLMRMMRSIVLQDVEGCATVLMEWSQGAVNYDAMVSEGEAFMERYYGLQLKDLNISAMLNDVVAIVRNYNIILPSDITLLAKACLTLEGFGRVIDPTFDLMSTAQTLVKDLAKDRYAPTKVARKLGNQLLDRVDNFLDERGMVMAPGYHGQGNSTDFKRIEKVLRRLESSTNHQTQGLLIATVMLIGTALMFLPEGPKIFGAHILGILVLLFAMSQSVWLLLIIWWTQRSID